MVSTAGARPILQLVAVVVAAFFGLDRNERQEDAKSEITQAADTLPPANNTHTRTHSQPPPSGRGGTVQPYVRQVDVLSLQLEAN